MAKVQFPAKLEFLFRPHRYKVARGGRGSAKSWSFARALLILGASRRLRILCTREVQESIKDSVHKLLTDQIQALGLGAKYRVLANEIRGTNGTEFIFSGLAQHTVESIKSFEGIDIVWVEEAQSVSKRSWSILIPTIRKDGSEIWVSFNPELDTDDTWVRFVEQTPPDCVSAEVNYTDNPWFPAVLDQERLHAKATMPADEYENVWEGKPRTALPGAIYAKEITDAVAKGRVCNMPYDPRLLVHRIWDLGWNDQMAIILAQKGVADVRVIGYMEDRLQTLDWYVAEARRMYAYNWGTDYLPHDGETRNLQTGKSAKEVLEALQCTVAIVPNIGTENGIKSARMLFPRTYFDREHTARLQTCLKRYRRAISPTTGMPGAPVHDEYSNGADSFRYLSIVADVMPSQAINAGDLANWQPGHRPASSAGY